ncbi:MAG: HAMP domain-containing histidine kinase [Chloroflexi bacterium]|nr:HAMP domain-containing histidine kinase [Chloroflexota bacterium]MCC6893994.1 HAMP domain-containing histidine kinase [Anaerolineae bacterium]
MITNKSRFLNQLLQSPLHLSALATLISLGLATFINVLFLSPGALLMTLLITLTIAAPMSYLTIKFVIDMRTTIEKQKIRLALEEKRADILAKFMQDAAHEFKTPLTLMSTNLYLGERAAEPEKKQTYHQQVNEQIQILNNLLDTILILTRLDSIDRACYERKTTKTKELVSTIRSLIHSDRIQIDSRSLNGDAEVSVNLDDLHLAIKQMVDNALRYSPETHPVTIQFVNSASWLDINIQDGGSGMSLEHMQHIFDRFYRADESHTTRGLGLGLAIAKRVMELHDGHIEVESEIDNGSLFTVSLPIR